MEYLFYNVCTRHNYSSIYPDFIGKEKAIIADAKYRPLDFLGSTKQKDGDFNSPYIGDDLKRMGLYLWKFCSITKGFLYIPCGVHLKPLIYQKRLSYTRVSGVRNQILKP